MKNKKIYLLLVILLLIILGAIFFALNKRDNTSIGLDTVNDLKDMIKVVYKNANVELPSIQTNEVKLDDEGLVSSYTGLKNNDKVEAIVASEPLMSSQAYSFVAIKFKKGADIEKIKEEMYNSINMRKWICVSAEKLYITNYKNTVVYVMSNEEWAKPVYEAFKNYVNNNNGKELEKSESLDYELPAEIKPVI